MDPVLARIRMIGESPRPVTVYELWIWLDTLMRFHGFDIPLSVDGTGLCMDCRLRHLPGGQRTVVLHGTQEEHA